jgi:hypothetical protein
MLTLARALGAYSPVDLPLVMLAGLMEHGQHDDRGIWSVFVLPSRQAVANRKRK